ncbi:MAG: cytosolic protein [Acidobacteria bacterium]|nr:cytosolic protein [Acidobacteriota bacterium]
MDDNIRCLIKEYVHENIDSFHDNRLAKLQGLKLRDILANKNPYLFKARNLNRADELMAALLDASLSSGEESSFGNFLEDLAIYIAEITGGGSKSAVEGLDIELTRGGVRYLIAVKSGQKWGNAGQHKKLLDYFKAAAKVLKQSKRSGPFQLVEGICYGRFGKPNRGEREKGHYIRLIGQSFWQLISGDPDLYVDLIEPLGHESEAHATRYRTEKDATYNRLTREFTIEYCDKDGNIDWPKLVRFVSETVSSESDRGTAQLTLLTPDASGPN